jgi:anti-sigma B factor antagonist
MTYDTDLKGDVAVMHIRGEADQWELGPFRVRLQRSLASGHGRAVLDLSEFRLLTSSMISLLIAEHRRATAMGGGIVLAALRPVARRSIELLGVDRVLRTAPTVADGIGALSA